MTITGEIRNQQLNDVESSNHRDSSDDVVMMDDERNKIDEENYNNNQDEDKSLERPFAFGCDDNWTWNKQDRSTEVRLSGFGCRTVHFHPNWSKGTAGIRGTRVLNNGRYYWEIRVSQRVFGTR